MSWIRLDDSFADHPKTLALSPEALVLYIRALCWSSRHLTDGKIPHFAVESLSAGLKEPEPTPSDGKPHGKPLALVRAGFWTEAEGGYLIHDFLEYNPSRTQVLARRKDRQAAGKIGADHRWSQEELRDGKMHGKPMATSHCDRINLVMAKPCDLDAPSRPLPRPLKKLSSSPRSLARSGPLSDLEFLEGLKRNPAYAHLNLDAELARMDAWLSARPERQKTRRFIVNWLLKLPAPLPPSQRKPSPGIPGIPGIPRCAQDGCEKAGTMSSGRRHSCVEHWKS